MVMAYRHHPMEGTFLAKLNMLGLKNLTL